ncbi:unnamed protein product [Gongylonema pulchrum]|uniref:RCC1 domain-containing protein 1 n=1 Tax=Gongylonema pulchrum TaxID=637853 RepID=A0A183DTD2_9BILA|nr:unnamed protein product [Gongylonema pulchrum]
MSCGRVVGFDEVLHTYFGCVEISRRSGESHILLKNYLLQNESSFQVKGSVRGACCTHNYLFLLVPLERCVYTFRIDSIPVYRLNIDEIEHNPGFKPMTNIAVEIEKMITPRREKDQQEGVPELAHLKLQPKKSLEFQSPVEVEDFLLCATSRSCYLVKNTSAGPSMYRIFTENKEANDELHLLQLGFQEAVLQVAAGNDHILILTSTGQVYSMGTGSRGELGHGTLESEQQPCLMEGLNFTKVAQLACGAWHSVALTTDGDVYVWGWNNSGQLGGCCAEGEILDIPYPLDYDECILAVAARRNGTLLKKSDHSVLTLGSTSFC